MSKDIKKALEHCIEWNCADCPNREELGSGETVCRGRLLPEVLEYVADLEAKLADSENQCRECKNLNKKIELNIKNKLMAENRELQKQLTDKDKEIEELIEELDDKNFCRDFVDLYTENRLKTQLLNENWKDKISFAIDKLEKVKENIHYLLSFDYNLLCKVNEQFDNQIKQLKEME